MTLRLGFIGSGQHTRRLVGIASTYDFCSIDVVYHPSEKPSSDKGSTSFDALLGCDAIFIVSPNSTHTGYLLRLQAEYSGYVFCEKPPVNRLADVEKLAGLDPGRHFFGFNLRYSDIATWAIAGIADGEIGKPIHAEAILTHGFAFKEQYLRSWKSDERKAPTGILENVAIHYVDLLATILGTITRLDATVDNFSRIGSVPDTANIKTSHQSGATGNVLVSYSAPYCETFTLIGQNGLLRYDSNVLTLQTPRDAIDLNGMFTTPAVIRSTTYSRETLYESSLRNEMDFFLRCCRDGRRFEPELFQRSIHCVRSLLQA